MWRKGFREGWRAGRASRNVRKGRDKSKKKKRNILNYSLYANELISQCTFGHAIGQSTFREYWGTIRIVVEFHLLVLSTTIDKVANSH